MSIMTGRPGSGLEGFLARRGDMVGDAGGREGEFVEELVNLFMVHRSSELSGICRGEQKSEAKARSVGVARKLEGI